MSDESSEKDDDLGPQIIAITWSLTVVSGLLLVAHLWVKGARNRILSNDVVLSISWLLLVVHTSISTYTIRRLGFGKHISMVSMENLLAIVKIINTTGSFGLFAIMLSKTSFAITLYQVMGKWWEMTVIALVVTINIIFIINAILPFVRCTPVEAGWNPFMDADCFDYMVMTNFSIFAAAFSAVMDLVLVGLSVAAPMKWTSTREKIGVLITASLGIMAAITSAVRGAMIHLKLNNDFTFNASALAIWMVTEIATTIMATSVTTLYSLLLPGSAATCPDAFNRGNPYQRSAGDDTFANGIHVISDGVDHPVGDIENTKNFSGWRRRSKGQRMLDVELVDRTG